MVDIQWLVVSDQWTVPWSLSPLVPKSLTPSSPVLRKDLGQESEQENPYQDGHVG
jgi:hypothetical protein